MTGCELLLHSCYEPTPGYTCLEVCYVPVLSHRWLGIAVFMPALGVTRSGGLGTPVQCPSTINVIWAYLFAFLLFPGVTCGSLVTLIFMPAVSQWYHVWAVYKLFISKWPRAHRPRYTYSHASYVPLPTAGGMVPSVHPSVVAQCCNVEAWLYLYAYLSCTRTATNSLYMFVCTSPMSLQCPLSTWIHLFTKMLCPSAKHICLYTEWPPEPPCSGLYTPVHMSA